MMGLLTENGPFHVDMKTGQTYTNPYGWNTHATYMAVDQPYGVGLSVADKDIVENDDEVATEMLAFIQNFYAKYPKYATVDLYMAGESFGGHVSLFVSHFLLVCSCYFFCHSQAQQTSCSRFERWCSYSSQGNGHW